MQIKSAYKKPVIISIFTEQFSSLESYLKFFWVGAVFAILLPIITSWLFMYYDRSLINQCSVMLDYKTSFVNQNNDVIFVGDSSCLMGVAPEIIEKETGLKVVNLATNGGAGIIGYETVIRKYLKSNPPPKLIVYYISPSIPNFYSVKSFEQVFSYMRNPDIGLFISNIGEYNFLHAMSALMTYITDKIISPFPKEDLKKMQQELRDSKGFQNQKENKGSLSRDSKINSRYKYGDYFNTANDPREKIKKLVSHFNNSETKVVVYLAPMPETEESFEYFKDIYKNIIINTPYKLENKNFSDYTHLNYQGAMANSKLVALFLKKFFNL